MTPKGNIDPFARSLAAASSTSVARILRFSRGTRGFAADARTFSAGITMAAACVRRLAHCGATSAVDPRRMTRANPIPACDARKGALVKRHSAVCFRGLELVVG